MLGLSIEVTRIQPAKNVSPKKMIDEMDSSKIHLRKWIYIYIMNCR